jgi:hypothetical protein
VRLRRLTALRNRLDRDRARADTRQSVQDRRTRTRHLIELGGLVRKAGLVELVEDDRATLLGAFLELAGRLQEYELQDEKPVELKARWRRSGLPCLRRRAGRRRGGSGGRGWAMRTDRFGGSCLALVLAAGSAIVGRSGLAR